MKCGNNNYMDNPDQLTFTLTKMNIESNGRTKNLRYLKEIDTPLGVQWIFEQVPNSYRI